MSEITKNISQAVFKINTAAGSGSGFYLKNEGVIVTNCHVVFGYKEVSIEDHQKDRYLAKVVLIDDQADIALLKPEREFDTPLLDIADVSLLQNRDIVFVLGFPFGMPYTETSGIVSSPNQLMNGRNYIQTDAAVNPGNSGGPVVDKDGRLVGITTCKFTEADNMGFAVPANVLKEQLESLKENTSLEYAVKCGSCKTLIYSPIEYCQNCGAKINQDLFEEVAPTSLEVFVEDAIRHLGINPILARAGNQFWEFYQGSSLLRFFIYDRNYLYATSPINALPTSNLDKVYSYLLSNPIAPYVLGVYENQIYVSYRVHISEIFSEQSETVKNIFTNLPLKADEMDDFLEQNYACPKSNLAKDV